MHIRVLCGELWRGAASNRGFCVRLDQKAKENESDSGTSVRSLGSGRANDGRREEFGGRSRSPFAYYRMLRSGMVGFVGFFNKIFTKRWI